MKKDIPVKLLMISGLSAFYTLVLVTVSGLVWQHYLGIQMDMPVLLRTCLIASGVVVLFSLVYEILFLQKERQIDSQIIRHLDKELQQAEINVLRNELDPHFVYNSLMPLYYLVKNDIQKAEAFACKLIQVYQYFLENRQNDFITLREELKFIENYFFLLQIRYKDAFSLSLQINPGADKLLVVPLSLQILIENVIKHNESDANQTLKISIHSERNHLVVTNHLRSRTNEISSSKIGLKNLRARYKILSGCDISVIRNKELFIVKIPLLRNAKTYDVNSYNRG
jgi:LytS/YehU family sensor histidine kinase